MIDCPNCRISFSPSFDVCPRCKTHQTPHADRVAYYVHQGEAIYRTGGTKDDVRAFLRGRGLTEAEVERGAKASDRSADSVETWPEIRSVVAHVFAMSLFVSLVFTYMALSSGASDRMLIRLDLMEDRLRDAGVTSGIGNAILISLTIAVCHSLAFFVAILMIPAYERWCGFGILLIGVSSLACAIVL